MSSQNAIAPLRRANLRRWLDERQINNTDLASKLGTGRAYVSLLFNKERHFGEKAARAIELALSMPAGYLDADGEIQMAVADWVTPADLDPGVYALVPRVEVRLSAGNGALSHTELKLPPLAFRKDWLAKKMVSGKGNLRICEVVGDSMEPYLVDHDTVLIDLGQRDVVSGEVYALRYGDELRIKRLSRRFDGGLVIASDNARYPEEALSAQDAEHITVLGRCLWRGG